MTFREIYLEELGKATIEYPLEYAWPLKDVKIVCDRMILALSKGTAVMDGLALRRTCRRAAIPMNRKSIMERLELEMEANVASEDNIQ